MYLNSIYDIVKQLLRSRFSIKLIDNSFQVILILNYMIFKDYVSLQDHSTFIYFFDLW